MSTIIDAKGKPCPTPVILAKQAMAAGEHSFTVLVDNTTAVENLKRLAGNQGFGAAVTQGEGVFSVAFTRTGCAACEEAVSAPLPAPGGDWAVFVGRDIIGDGDRELGANLMRMFFYTLAQGEDKPGAVLFMNAGVRLPTLDEQIPAHLKALGADVSRSGLGRYKQQVDKVAARLRESRAMAEAVMERMGAQAATGKSGAALIEMLTTLTSDYLLRRMDDPDAEIEVDELRALARTVKERAQAARATQDYDLKLREEARREAEEAMRKAVEKAAKESPAAASPAEVFARIQAVYRGEA